MARMGILAALGIAGLLITATPGLAGEHRLGGGFHYWETLDDFQDSGFDIDDSGLAPVLSYQYIPGGLIRFEIDVEYFEKGFAGSTEAAYSPQAYVLLGGGLYAGLGVGVTVSSGLEDEVSDPFYAARAGFEMALLPSVTLDINANYRFGAWDELDDYSTDTITLGALVRFAF